MKKFTIYGATADVAKEVIATVEGPESIVNMLFDYGEFSEYEIFYDVIWVEVENND